MIFLAILFGAVVCGAVLGTFLTAQGAEAASAAAPAGGGPGLWGPLFRMGAALAAVLGVLVLAVYALRKFGSGRLGGVVGGQQIRMVANQFLGGKNRLSVVEVEGARFLLGISADRITLLCRLDRAEWGPTELREGSAAARGIPSPGGE